MVAEVTKADPALQNSTEDLQQQQSVQVTVEGETSTVFNAALAQEPIETPTEGVVDPASFSLAKRSF